MDSSLLCLLNYYSGSTAQGRKVELEFTLYSQVRKNSETDTNGVAASLLDYLVDKKIKLF